MDEKKLVNVYLFSEMDSSDNLVAVQYELTPEEVTILKNSVAASHNLKIIPFGDTFHHVDDIIRFNISKKPGYLNFA